MKIDENQKKLILLTMKLDIEVQKFNLLCNKLDELKKENILPNSPEYESLLKEFTKKYNEIVKLNTLLKNI